MPMLLPSTETIQEESNSRETLIAAGTANNSSRGSTNLDVSFVNRQCGGNISSASTSKNSSRGTSKISSRRGSINLGIPIVDGKCGSNLSSSLDSWFHLFLKVISLFLKHKIIGIYIYIYIYISKN